jgi:hypothetical protein
MKTYLKYNLIIFGILIFIIIFLFIYQTNMLVEGFQTNKWSDELTNRFLEFQNTINENDHQYNLKVLQQQATSEEAEYLLKNGYWPWSDEIKYLYMDAVSRNKIIKVQPKVALDYAMKVYNENAVKKLLSWNTKEGQFLLYGALLGNKSNHWEEPYNDASYSLIKCDITNKPVMKKLTYYASNGYLLPKENIIENKDIPKELPGFNFFKNVCNPCNVFKGDGVYDCPFLIQTSSKPEWNNITSIWRKLWNIK